MSDRKWKFGTIVFFLLSLLLFFQWYKEWKNNKPFRKELEAFKSVVERVQKEHQELKLRVSQREYPLEYEKIVKDKEGKGWEGETLIIVSDQLLKSITLPFLTEKTE